MSTLHSAFRRKTLPLFLYCRFFGGGWRAEGVHDSILNGLPSPNNRASICLFLNISCGLIRPYSVLHFLPNKPILMQTRYEIRRLPSARRAPISICQRLQACITQQQIYTTRWPILFCFVPSWNGPYSLTFKQ